MQVTITPVHGDTGWVQAILVLPNGVVVTHKDVPRDDLYGNDLMYAYAMMADEMCRSVGYCVECNDPDFVNGKVAIFASVAPIKD